MMYTKMKELTYKEKGMVDIYRDTIFMINHKIQYIIMMVYILGMLTSASMLLIKIPIIPLLFLFIYIVINMKVNKERKNIVWTYENNKVPDKEQEIIDTYEFELFKLDNKIFAMTNISYVLGYLIGLLIYTRVSLLFLLGVNLIVIYSLTYFGNKKTKEIVWENQKQ